MDEQWNEGSLGDLKGWERVKIDDESVTELRVCPLCWALIRNRRATMERHRDWHRSAGV